MKHWKHTHFTIYTLQSSEMNWREREREGYAVFHVPKLCSFDAASCFFFPNLHFWFGFGILFQPFS